ncbi:MAG: DUF177 domain-containing protein [Candidatus Delongbacteria bacterium]|jgi:uncharacterized protein|nr:DUF177 domain-containing protein [Candidatus Delongbacteria bacterium]
MKIKIDRLKEGDNSVTFDQDSLISLEIKDHEILSGSELTLVVIKNDNYLHITGSNKVKYQEHCDRCGNEFKPTIYIEIDYVFHLGNEKRGNSDNLEIIRPNENDGYLIFDQYYIETFYLSLPLKKLCFYNCKGLCPKCGINLNTDSCTCDEEKTIDPRWEKLAEFAKKKKK